MKKKMKKQRILAIVLSAVVFLSTQGITVFAGTEKGDGSAGGTEQFQNPQHHCNGSWGDREGDSTDWSYVNFGSYPQTEIPEENLTSEVTEASYNEQGDAMVNGVKYRRISKENTVSSDNFGDRSFRYFKWEPLKWRVLKNDGSTLFLMADKGIDCRKFHETYENVIWETSSIRQWLSGTFYPEAFSAREQAVIQEQPTGEGDGAAGNITDKVYLLSIEEAFSYGFCEYRKSSASRGMYPSEYAYAMGVSTWNGNNDNHRCYWWLRSQGNPDQPDMGYRAAHIDSYGAVYGLGYDTGYDLGMTVNVDSNAVVPVLHVGVSFFAADEGAGGDDGSEGDTGVTPNPNPGEEMPTPNPGEDTTKPNPGEETPTPNPDTEDTTPQEKPVKVKKLSISAVSTKIAAGKKVTLKVTVSPKNATIPEVEWKTDNKKYATVNSKGVVTTKKAGKGKTVKITATAKDGSGKKASIKLKLMKNAVTKVKIKKTNKTLKAGKSVKLKAEVWINGKNANNTLQWTVSNSKYASVNSKGKVTAKKAGKGKKVTVTAASTDGTNKKDKVTISIK